MPNQDTARQLTHDEKRAIRRVRRALADLPPTLWLYCHGDNTSVLDCDEDGNPRRLPGGDLDPDAVLDGESARQEWPEQIRLVRIMDFGVVLNYAAEPVHKPAPDEPHETYVPLSQLQDLLTSDEVVEAFCQGCFGYTTEDEGHLRRIRDGLQAAAVNLSGRVEGGER